MLSVILILLLLVGCRQEGESKPAGGENASITLFGVGLGVRIDELPESKTVREDKDNGLLLVDKYQGEVARVTVDVEGRVTSLEADTLISVEKDRVQWLVGLEDYKDVEKKLAEAGMKWTETEEGADVVLDESALMRLVFTKNPQFLGAVVLKRRN
jgi:hypothetical protein